MSADFVGLLAVWAAWILVLAAIGLFAMWERAKRERGKR